MILDEEIFEVAKTIGFGHRVNPSTNLVECWEEQLIDFAQKIYQMGYDEGCYETSHFTGHTGLYGEPEMTIFSRTLDNIVKLIASTDGQIQDLKDEIDYWKGE